MRITERRLRSIIRNVIRESMHDDDEGYHSDDSMFAPFDDEEYPSDDPMFAPFDDEGSDLDHELHDDMEIIDADNIPQLDHEISGRGEMRRFMQMNRRAGAERDRGSYASRGHAHPDQIDMLDDMGELNRAYDDDGEEYEQ